MKNVICINDQDYGCAALVVNDKDTDLVKRYIETVYSSVKSKYGPHDHIFNFLMDVGKDLGLEIEFIIMLMCLICNKSKVSFRDEQNADDK